MIRCSVRNISCGSSATGSRAGARGSLPPSTEFCREGCLRVHIIPRDSLATGSCTGARGLLPLGTRFEGEVVSVYILCAVVLRWQSVDLMPWQIVGGIVFVCVP